MNKTVSEYNMNTELLAAELAAAYASAILSRVKGEVSGQQPGVFDAAWYRVAERAKELRA